MGNTNQPKALGPLAHTRLDPGCLHSHVLPPIPPFCHPVSCDAEEKGGYVCHYNIPRDDVQPQPPVLNQGSRKVAYMQKAGNTLGKKLNEGSGDMTGEVLSS